MSKGPGITPAPRVAPAASVLNTREGKKHNAHPESIEQRRFVSWWRNQPGSAVMCATASLNGAKLSGLQAKLAKAAGMEKGPPDWTLFERGRGRRWVEDKLFRPPCIGLVLEFKRPGGGGVLTKDQKRWHKKLTELGFRVEIVETAEDAARQTEDYLHGMAWQTNDSRTDSYYPEDMR